MSDRKLNHLCYNTASHDLAYSWKDSYGTDRPLVYSILSGEETIVTFSWPSNVKDLDILAYWSGAPDLTAGYNHGSGGTSGVYRLSYSGDKTGTGDAEWCKIKMSPWGTGYQRTFIVHFNVYGYSETYPGNTCTVIASQPNGNTFFKDGQNASINAGQPAKNTDPYCIVTFDATGTLISLT